MDINIQKMTIEHIEQIKDSLKEKFDEFWTHSVLRKELENPLCEYIVALEDDKVVGYAGIWKPSDEAHITNVVIRKDKRGNKIGTKLLDRLICLAKEENLKCVTLEVNVNNENAIKLYNKYNFKQVGKRNKYYNNTDDAIIMTLDI